MSPRRFRARVFADGKNPRQQAGSCSEARGPRSMPPTHTNPNGTRDLRQSAARLRQLGVMGLPGSTRLIRSPSAPLIAGAVRDDPPDYHGRERYLPGGTSLIMKRPRASMCPNRSRERTAMRPRMYGVDVGADRCRGGSSPARRGRRKGDGFVERATAATLCSSRRSRPGPESDVDAVGDPVTVLDPDLLADRHREDPRLERALLQLARRRELRPSSPWSLASQPHRRVEDHAFRAELSGTGSAPSGSMHPVTGFTGSSASSPGQDLSRVRARDVRFA